MRRAGGGASAVEGRKQPLEIELKPGGDLAALDRGWRVAVLAGGEEHAEAVVELAHGGGEIRANGGRDPISVA